nr:hypothetical protein [Flavihumibacter sp.]
QLRLVLTGFLVFLLLVLGVEILTMPTAFSFLHTEVPYYRIRLLTSESSWTGSIIIVFGVIYLVLATTKKQLAFGYSFLLINILFTGSKMILICLPIAVFFILMRNVTVKKVLGIAIAGLLFYLLLLPQLINSLSVDLEQYTSIVSRSTAFLTAFLTGGHSVIGVGGLYPYYFINTIQDSLDLILNFIPLGNTSEVEGWGTEGFKAISGGSTLAHFTMQMGVFGILFFGMLTVKLYSLTRISNYLFFGVIYFVVSNMFTEIFLLRHAWPVFFAFIVFYNKYQDEFKNTGRYA